MGRRRRLRPRIPREVDPESQIDEGVDLVLSHWPEFHTATDLLRGIRISQFKSDLLDYFSTTPTEPNLNDLAEMLKNTLYSRLCGYIMGDQPFDKTAEQLLMSYHASLREESIEFPSDVDQILLQWLPFQRLLNNTRAQMQCRLKFSMISLFFDNPEVDVEGLTMMIYDFMINFVESLVDFASCEKVAPTFWKILQACLDEKFDFILALRKQFDEGATTNDLKAYDKNHEVIGNGNDQTNNAKPSNVIIQTKDNVTLEKNKA